MDGRVVGYRGKAIASFLAVAGIGIGGSVAAAAALGPVEGAAAGTIALAGLVITGALHDRRIRSSLRDMAKAADDVAGGDLARRAAIATGDELQFVSRAFNRMTDRLVEQRAILAGIDAAIMVVDRHHEVVWCNAQASRWFGLSGTRLRCYQALCGVGDPCRGCPADACFVDGGIRSIDVTRGEGGTARHYQATVSPVRDERGEVTQVLELVQDVTERRLLELQLREADGLARIGELAGTIAHEFKNPLASMRAALELASGDIPEKTRAAKLVPLALAEIARLDASVRDLLHCIRPLELKLVPCRFETIVGDARDLVRPHVAVARLTFRTRGFDASEPIHGDSAALRQVVANLIVNAGEAMLGTPAADAVITLTLRREGGLGVLEIEDRGPGVPEALRGSLFKPFFTTKREGTGLGLAICRRIVEAHGGSISLEHPPAGGLRVLVRVPEEARSGS